MKYRKIVALALATIMCTSFAFAGCSNGDQHEPDATATEAEEIITETTTAAETEETEATTEETEETSVQIEFDGEALYNQHYAELGGLINYTGITDQENIVSAFYILDSNGDFHAEYLYETPELASEDAEAWVALQDPQPVFEIIDGVPTYSFEISTLEVYGSLLVFDLKV